MEDPEFTDFWQLLSYHDAITPEIQRVALAAEVFWPCEIYYHAPADVRDGLIHALLSAEYSSAASNLMSCLAMQGDDKAMETLLELERNPRPWRKGLYVDPSSYAQIGGWTFDKEGQKIQLNFDTCYPMVKGTTSEKSPVRIGRAREDTCPHCGGRMVDMLVLDGRDERLKFLGLDGILTATCCPNCVGFLKGPAFNSFTLDGGVEVFPSELFDGAEKTDCYVSLEDYKALTENPFVLGEAPVPLFYGAACQDVNTVGGFANWVQDAEYTTCPHCGKPMTMNLRSDDAFVEDKGWHRAAERYADFLRTRKGQKILFLELGVGYNTPVIIKYPFWQMTAKNPNATYACINREQAFAPEEIASRAIVVNDDIGKILQAI